jgi:hypothetical protein
MPVKLKWELNDVSVIYTDEVSGTIKFNVEATSVNGDGWNVTLPVEEVATEIKDEITILTSVINASDQLGKDFLESDDGIAPTPKNLKLDAKVAGLPKAKRNPKNDITDELNKDLSKQAAQLKKSNHTADEILATLPQRVKPNDKIPGLSGKPEPLDMELLAKLSGIDHYGKTRLSEFSASVDDKGILHVSSAPLEENYSRKDIRGIMSNLINLLESGADISYTNNKVVVKHNTSIWTKFKGLFQ